MFGQPRGQANSSEALTTPAVICSFTKIAVVTSGNQASGHYFIHIVDGDSCGNQASGHYFIHLADGDSAIWWYSWLLSLSTRTVCMVASCPVFFSRGCLSLLCCSSLVGSAACWLLGFFSRRVVPLQLALGWPRLPFVASPVLSVQPPGLFGSR